MSEPLILERDVELTVEDHCETRGALTMPAWNIHRYDRPSENTIFPLEYAFHLLGDLRGKTVLDLGCGSGVNSVIMAALGASVVAVDVSDENLAVTAKRAYANRVGARVDVLRWESATIPTCDNRFDHVLCASSCRLMDPIVTARQMRRVMKPGGTAVFEAPLTLPGLLGAVMNSTHDALDNANRGLSDEDVKTISRAVGMSGRCREFGLTTRLIYRSGLPTFSAIARVTQTLDAAVLNKMSFMRRFASVLVWEALKES